MAKDASKLKAQAKQAQKQLKAKCEKEKMALQEQIKQYLDLNKISDPASSQHLRAVYGENPPLPANTKT